MIKVSAHRTDSASWGGVDFSGLTVVLGVGTGRLLRLLNEQIAASDGNLVVVSYKLANLRALAPLSELGPLTPIHARPRQNPVLSETVDLLVANGVLREVPPSRLDVMLEEIWRLVVPGGRVRVSDIIEPSEAEYNEAWTARNGIVRKLGDALDRPTALSADVTLVAKAMRTAGFEDLAVSLLPGFALTDAWLEETVNAIRTMASRLADPDNRYSVLNEDLNALLSAYARGGQRAAERFVIKGSKAGDLSLAMEASFTEEDLLDPDW